MKVSQLSALRFSDGSFLMMCNNCKFKRLEKYPQLRQHQGNYAKREQEAKVAHRNESGL